MTYTLKTLIGPEIAPYLNDVAALRIEVFREFPYLYEGSVEYEMRYLQDYANCEQAILVIALYGEQVVGASTGLPMQFASESFAAPMVSEGYKIDQLFYFAESVVQLAHRGNGIGVQFFNERERFAKSLPNITHSCFCAVVRSDDHPLKPELYRSNHSLWQRMGYRQLNAHAQFKWQDINESEESEKSLTFWSKALYE
jgi:GNAT superfamily N-acetyltransferase